MHSICRIAEVLLTLQQVGNVKYTGWVLQVPCSTDRQIIAELQEQAKVMEDELHQWKDLVKKRREDFYELNYYTTLQLLILRKELVKVKHSDQAAAISSDVLALLQSISSQVTHSSISSAVCKVITAESKLESLSEMQDCLETDEVSAPLSEVTTSSAGKHSAEVIQDAEPEIDKHEPTLTEEDLDDYQKEIMANICSRINCSKTLVLKCFEECHGDDLGRYDYEHWCNENIAKFMDDKDYSDISDSGEDSTDSSDSDSGSESQEFKYSTGMLSILDLLYAIMLVYYI